METHNQKQNKHKYKPRERYRFDMNNINCKDKMWTYEEVMKPSCEWWIRLQKQQQKLNRHGINSIIFIEI